MPDASTLTSKAAPAEQRVLELEAQLAEERAKLAALTVERDNLRLAYQNLQHELELMRRRILVAKAERLDTAQLELEFAHKLAALDALDRARALPAAQAEDVTPDGDGAGSGPSRRKGRDTRAKAGRRNLRLCDLPEERIELTVSSLEGNAERIDWEESCRIAWRRGGFVRTGTPLDRSTMSRWAEDVGATVGATVALAMRKEALRTAFCISTDATGVLVQPIKGGDQPRRSCRRAHFLVQIADADHVFFEYMPRETSAAIGELFRGFSGYIQADAKSVYDLLFKPPDQRPPPEDDDEPDLGERHEVGCRVGGDVAAPAPHRPGRADFPHPVPHVAASLAVV